MQVPEKNRLLRCFQYLSLNSISYGDFCWNGECTNCQIWYHEKGQTESNDKPALSCRAQVIEGMVITKLSQFIHLDGISKRGCLFHIVAHYRTASGSDRILNSTRLDWGLLGVECLNPVATARGSVLERDLLHVPCDMTRDVRARNHDRAGSTEKERRTSLRPFCLIGYPFLSVSFSLGGHRAGNRACLRASPDDLVAARGGRSAIRVYPL